MATSVAQRRKEIENQLLSLTRQADEMDAKIRNYLADRQNKPHPRHMEFIERIQRYRIDPSISNKHLETMLDNLQWKVYYYSRAWRQLWENAEAMQRAQARQQAAERPRHRPEHTEDGQDGKRPIYSVDRLWKIQRDKLEASGDNPDVETKEKFVKRIKQRYGKLASEKARDEEIVMTFDKDTKRCTLALKKSREGLQE